MFYQAFHDLFPEMAERETRCITVLDKKAWKIPRGQYFFHEQYCNQKGCDCRRVFLCVTSSLRKGVEAVIAWGWASREHYVRWFHDDDPDALAQLKGPILNPLSPQSPLAPVLLELTRDVLLQDGVFTERVRRHYRLFKGKIDGVKGKGSKRRSRAIRTPRKRVCEHPDDLN